MVDTMIRLFEDNATVFTTNGIGYLSDAAMCQVTEERNGAFELKMKYPIKGIRYSEIKLRRIIVAKPNPYADPQPFRIYSISRPISGLVTIDAEHISYDMTGYPVNPMQATTVSEALLFIKNNSSVTCPFTFWTDKTTSGNFKITTPVNMRNCLGGMEGSILDVFGTGEYEFDKYDVKLHLHRGADRGVTLRYGKNITDLQQEENNANVCTGIYPYWYSEEDGLVRSNPLIINGPGTYNYSKIEILDLSYEWVDKPTSADLKASAESYITANNIGVPTVSLDVSFVHLADSPEYAEFKDLETVHLCDTVTVIFEELGVNASAKCVKTVYDCLTDKYDSISLGDPRTNLSSEIAKNQVSTNTKFNDQKNYLEKAVGNATSMITGNLGGYVILHSSTGGKKPDEILIMDTENINTATKIWRWNKSGLGYSSTGYAGPYGLALTALGQIVANFITAGEMSANRINGGTLILGGSNNSAGLIRMYDENNELDGIWNNTGLKLHKHPFVIYGNMEILASHIMVDLFTSYSASYFSVSIDGKQKYRQGFVSSNVANSIDEAEYAMMLGHGCKALEMGILSDDSSLLTASFWMNNGLNPYNRTERFIFGGTVHFAAQTTFNVDLIVGLGTQHTDYGPGSFNVYHDGLRYRQSLIGDLTDYGLTIGANTKSLQLGIFGVNNSDRTTYFWMNNGRNPYGRTERFFFNDTAYFNKLVTFVNGFDASGTINFYSPINFTSGSSSVYVWLTEYDGIKALNIGQSHDRASLYVRGSIGCSGNKHRVVETEHYGKRSLNAMESPEPRFFDFGSCTIGEDGKSKYEMDPIFLETVEKKEFYQVFLTRTNQPTGPYMEPWVEKFDTYFIVHGAPGSTYDVMVSMIQKGCSGVRLKKMEIPD